MDIRTQAGRRCRLEEISSNLRWKHQISRSPPPLSMMPPLSHNLFSPWFSLVK